MVYIGVYFMAGIVRLVHYEQQAARAKQAAPALLQLQQRVHVYWRGPLSQQSAHAVACSSVLEMCLLAC